MQKFFKIIILLNLFFVLFFPLKSEEITENTSVIKKVKELGKFDEPKNYPTGMQNLFLAGCNGFECTAEKVSKAYEEVGLSKDGMPSLDAILDPSFDIAAHLDAMDTVASEAGLQADIASSNKIKAFF